MTFGVRFLRESVQRARRGTLPSGFECVIVDLLVDAGAKFQEKDGWPHDLLSWAVTLGSSRGARRLVERGAPLDLWCAAGLGDLERLRSFFDAEGRPVAGASRYGVTRFDDRGERLPAPPSDRIDLLSDALYIASRNGQLEAARFLLEHGANPNWPAYDRAPALHWAMLSGNRTLVTLLLEHGADPRQGGGEHQSQYRQFALRTPIEWAAPELLRRAITGDPSLIEERDDHWGPVLHAAAERGLDELVEVVLDAGADPRVLDHAGRTASECAQRAPDGESKDRTLALIQGALDR